MAAAGRPHCSQGLVPALIRILGCHPGSAPGDGVARAVRLLKQRELEAAALAAAGYGNKEIATRMCAGESSIKRYLGNAFRKLGIDGRGGLRVLAPFLHAALGELRGD